MTIGSTTVGASATEASSPKSRSDRFAFERQIKFITPPVRTRSYASLWKEVFSHGGNVVRIYQLKPWTFVEYPSVAEADAAFGLMKEKNVVGPLYRTKELIRALKGLDPVTVPEKEAKPTLQFFKQLKFLTEECEDKSEEGVKGLFYSAGRVVGTTSLGPWTFVQFKSPEKARAALDSMKQLTESVPSLRETVELTQCLGPAKTEARFKHAFDRQLKFDTKANQQLSIPDIKNIFETGGCVTKVFHLGKWTFVEYPTVEEAEAAFNIMSKKKEVKFLKRTEELVAALRAKQKTRQLRIARNENEDLQKVSAKCNCPTAVPLEVSQSWNWTFVEYRSPEEASAAFEFLRENKVFSDIQKTAELDQWLRKNSTTTGNAQRQVRFNTADNAEALPSLEHVHHHFAKVADVVSVFQKDKDTFVEYGSVEDALKAYQAMSGAEEMRNLHPTKELRRVASSRLPRLTEE